MARSHHTLAGALDAALAGDGAELDALAAADPVDRRDAARSLGLILGLHTAPLEVVGPAVRHQHHPAVAALKHRLERDYLERLGRRTLERGGPLPADAVAAIRKIAAEDMVPAVYRWIADRATGEELVTFLALEGGPDAGFDDLVATAQVGLAGEAKLELARNYWDEMGRGDAVAVHTELYRRLVAATGLDRVDLGEVPVEVLERSLLGAVLATNRALQPEMVGALGLIELQAGPRCRKVVAGMRRTGLGADALAFYEEHAEADPRHGKAWLDNVVASLGGDPFWAEGMVRGARWRSAVNADFFAAVAGRLGAAAGEPGPADRLRRSA